MKKAVFCNVIMMIIIIITIITSIKILEISLNA